MRRIYSTKWAISSQVLNYKVFKAILAYSLMGIIYKIQNNINNKCYIGQTKRTVDKRWKEHCKSKDAMYIDNAIHKHTPENFTVTIIKETTDDLLDELEKKYIIEYNSLYPNGYNLESGGRLNKIMSQESRNKMREKKLGNKNPN